MLPALSARLAAVAALVPRGESVADIGTDHGLLPCFLVASGAVPQAVAADVSVPSLDKARARVKRMGLSARIAVRCGDGLAVLQPHEVSTVAIAGMGGQTIAGILQRGAVSLAGTTRLVLSPNSGAEALRRFLVAGGWSDVAGTMVRDRAHFYPVEAWQRGEVDWTAADFRWGRHLRVEPDSGLGDFLTYEYTRLLGAREMARRGRDDADADVRALTEEVAQIEAELKRLRSGR